MAKNLFQFLKVPFPPCFFLRVSTPAFWFSHATVMYFCLSFREGEITCAFVFVYSRLPEANMVLLGSTHVIEVPSGGFSYVVEEGAYIDSIMFQVSEMLSFHACMIE